MIQTGTRCHRALEPRASPKDGEIEARPVGFVTARTYRGSPNVNDAGIVCSDMFDIEAVPLAGGRCVPGQDRLAVEGPSPGR
jgi:hypothetical protein